MNKDEAREHWTSALIGLACAGVGFAVAIVPQQFWAGAIVSACIAGITCVLIAERVTTLKHIREIRDEVSRKMRNSEAFRSSITTFEDEGEALTYVETTIRESKLILNTRLEPVFEGANFDIYSGALSAFDVSIIDAVQKGAEYRMVYDQSRRAEVEAFARKLGKPGKGAGRAVFYEMETGNKPLMQMLILGFEQAQVECLVGWRIGHERRLKDRVVGFREPQIVQFFETLFERYTRASARVWMSGDELLSGPQGHAPLS